VHQEKEQAIWRIIAAVKPDVFVMLGDLSPNHHPATR
jgi:hypothetical protein